MPAPCFLCLVYIPPCPDTCPDLRNCDPHSATPAVCNTRNYVASLQKPMAGATYFTDPYRVTKFVIITLRPKTVSASLQKSTAGATYFTDPYRVVLHCLAQGCSERYCLPSTAQHRETNKFSCHLFPCQKRPKVLLPSIQKSMAGATYFTDPYRVTKFVIIILRPKNCIALPCSGL